MDERKVESITNWPEPTTIKELQRFLGFANFYRQFIKDYSSITHQLTSLLRNKPKSLSWSPAATNAFNRLKEAFTTAPLLVHPDPELPFIVEVDTSTTGVGAVLSQQQGTPSRLHPCAFFSRKLSPVEVNYTIGDRELLAVKLALEEWRHWLEGAKYAFLVLTDHKNLEYLCSAKRLNPRQACWAMFFSQFNYTISYRPGSKNTKADALSRLYAPEEKTEEPEPIIPSSLIVSPITWSEETIPSSNASTNLPPGCPPGLLYITRTQRIPTIHSAHTSLGTGPGVTPAEPPLPLILEDGAAYKVHEILDSRRRSGQLEFTTPLILKPTDLKEVMEETTVHLSCSAEAPCPKQPPTISWSYIPESAHITTQLQEKPDKTQSVFSHMTFKASYMDHRRNISCTAKYPRNTSNDSTVETTVMLRVLYKRFGVVLLFYVQMFPPKETHITIDPFASVSFGTNVTLTCKSKASPSNNMVFFWHKCGNENQLVSGEQLTFTVNSSGGQYFCIAKNEHGIQMSEEIQLTVAEGAKGKSIQ
ncbi:uncharacterized protein LOC125257720 [Megalobrama amblycephala]|uniref:uncharacterized protein LOC125257720 n=1 Tax=Megalobrama amblycephala TaxID=75352 RepID=UPI0020141401|nr:uncharacterized protein LOC125257720 [Megalobrama amblycephala]